MGNACNTLLAAVFVLSVAAISPTVSAAKPGYYKIAQAKSLPPGTEVYVNGVVTYLESGECYIQDPYRSAGIWVLGTTEGISVGKLVGVTGTCGTLLGEPVIGDAIVYVPYSSPPIRPFGMSNLSVGGASATSMWIWDRVWRRYLDGRQWKWRWVWARTSGATNTGLLVTTWGSVKSIYHSAVNGLRWLYVDDGSAVSDLGDTGILVYTDADVEMGDYVAVTGVSSTEASLDDAPPHIPRLIRVIRTRDASDVRVLRRIEQPVYPFSDEFDSTALDPGWLICPGTGELSLTSCPGWLTITPVVEASPLSGKPETTALQLVQRNLPPHIPGDPTPAPSWTLDMKVRHESVAGATQVIRVDSKDGSVHRPYATWPPGVSIYCSGDHTNVVIGRTIFPVESSTVYLRLRQGYGFGGGGAAILGSVSTDGVTYTSQAVTYAYGSLISICAYAWASKAGPPPFDFKAHIDYIRFNVEAGGGDER